MWKLWVPPATDGGENPPCELWRLTVGNTSDRTRRISVFPYVDMHLTGGSTLMDFIAVLGGYYDPDRRAVFGINSCVKFPPTFKAVFATDSDVAAATVSRDEFIGHYRDYRNPRAVELGNVHNPEAGTEWLGASLRHDVTLAPGERITMHYVLGVIENPEEGQHLIGRYLVRGAADTVLKEIEQQAEAMVTRGAVQTPDAQFDRWLNVWLKHQLRFVARWGRVIGRGYRDMLQDCFAHRITEPARARQNLAEVFSKQFPSGRCIRAWRLPNAQLDLQHYADSPSWMIMALSMYLKETADFGFLDEDVPFLNAQDPYRGSAQSASAFDHVVIAQRYLLGDRGQYGLSKIHYGDWCDTMNGVGQRGEGVSVMLSMQVKWGCDLLAELVSQLVTRQITPRGWSRAMLQQLQQEMTDAAMELSEAINRHAWDGEWYIRAYDDDGLPVGSTKAPASDKGELRIFLNPQSWSIISGIADPQRAEQALHSVRDNLETGYGVVLSYPQSTFLKPRIGQMSAMTPGFYENGSVYTHGNCFYAAALAMAGQGEQAWQAIRSVLPDTDNKPNTDTEPFVIPNMYIGPVVERRMQRNLYLSGWRTGSAAWIYLTATEWILGARAEYTGLRIDPHLPDGWKEATLDRPFRSDTYRITLNRSDGHAQKVRSITVDGKPIQGDTITPIGDGALHEVHVNLNDD